MAVPESSRTKIAILGGGVGAMSAAFGLTEAPNWQERYDITVYQLGWRLGGKGASGRNPARGERIEEHGLHIWFGFYDNAFRIMQTAYERCHALGLTPGSPFRDWTDAFKPHNLLTAMENVEGEWRPWPIRYSVELSSPGHGITEPTPWFYFRFMLKWLVQMVEARFSARHGIWSLVTTEAVQTVRFVGGVTLNLVHAIEAGLGLRHGESAAAAPRSNVHRAHDLAHAMPADPTEHGAQHHHALLALLDGFQERFVASLESDLVRDEDLRRDLVLIDLFVAMARGMLVDGVLLHGFDCIDRYDAREWLRRHGCRSADSSLVRGMYDLVFAYVDGDLARADFAAGTALRAVLRILFTYHGSICYEMQAGMGDTVFSPPKLMLRARGVKFKFFHTVTNLGLSGDRTTVETIDVDVQARVRPEVVAAQGDYQPLVTIKGVPSWPSAPLYDQLVDGEVLRAALEQRGLDLESAWWTQMAERITLRRGQDFDTIVLGISLGALPFVAPELMAANPSFRDMVEKIPTVQTQAFQLWLDRDIEALGWVAPEPAIVGAYTEPIDTWADMSHLIDRESWSAGDRVKNIAYFCAALATPPRAPLENTDYPVEQREAVKATALEFLTTSIRPLWPKATDPVNPHGLDWNRLVDPDTRPGPARFDAQYWRANVNPSDRYVLSAKGTTQYRLRADESGFGNVFLAGDWTNNGVNLGCVEAAAVSGLQAARAIGGYPEVIYGEETSSRARAPQANDRRGQERTTLGPATLDYCFSYSADLAPPGIVGEVAGQLKINWVVTGGTVSGPRLSGKLKPVGGDWLTLRSDGVAETDVRIVIETDDGALINGFYNGLSDLGPDGYEKFRQQQPLGLVPTVHVAYRFACGHPKYQWLNRRLFVGSGQVLLDQRKVLFDVYEAS